LLEVVLRCSCGADIRQDFGGGWRGNYIGDELKCEQCWIAWAMAQPLSDVRIFVRNWDSGHPDAGPWELTEVHTVVGDAGECARTEVGFWFADPYPRQFVDHGKGCKCRFPMYSHRCDGGDNCRQYDCPRVGLGKTLAEMDAEEALR